MENFGFQLLANRDQTSSSSEEEITYDEIQEMARESNKATCLLSLSKSYRYYMRNRKLTSVEFRECLEVYWNNQDYYTQRNDTEHLTGLEVWFLHVVEPVCNKFITTIEDWISRENIKSTGKTYYCSPEARKLIKVKNTLILQSRSDLRISRILAEELIKKKSRKGKSSAVNK